MIEYVVWGIPPGGDHEVVLYTLARSRQQAEKVIETLKNKHGCRAMRIHELDLSKPPEWGKNLLNNP